MKWMIGWVLMLAVLVALPAPMVLGAEAVSGAGSYKTIMHRLATDRLLWRSGPLLFKKVIADLYK